MSSSLMSVCMQIGTVNGPRVARRQAGLSMVELLVGIAIGLLVVAAASMLTATQLGENRRMLLETQLQQDLRATVEIITRQLRRAGAVAQPMNYIWTEQLPGADAGNTDDMAPNAFGVPATEVTFRYARGPAGQLGFRLQGSRIQARLVLTPGGWQDLTDNSAMEVTAFSVTPFHAFEPSQPDRAGTATYALPQAVCRPQHQLLAERARARVQRQRHWPGPVRSSSGSHLEQRSPCSQRRTGHCRRCRMPRMKDCCRRSAVRLHRRAALDAQRGAATLLVVMVLFFVMSLMAAYSSRNIIFEQRTSSNLQAANVVQETAEAGMEWVLSMLNSANITNACTPNLDPSAPTPSFRQRYLSTNVISGNIDGSLAFPAGATTPVASCGFDQANQQWLCSCPVAGVAAVPAFSPAFSVRFVVPAALRPGVIRAEINACSQSSLECLTFQPSEASYCRATACAAVALQSGLRSAPTAALTALGSINAAGAASLSIFNTVAGASGVTIVAGGPVNLGAPGTMELRGPPGTPPSRTLVRNDPGLSAAAPAFFTPERMFAAFFGVWPTTYDLHPGAVTVNCAGGCNSLSVRNASIVNPDRIILLQGNVALDGGGDIGSALNPVLLVIQGNLTFSAPTDVYGFVYVRPADWVTAGNGQIIGGAAAQGLISGTGSFTVAHDPAILRLLRIRTGSMVKVPGSWVDFQ